MVPKDTNLPPKICKLLQKSGIETTPSADDNVDPTEHPWSPEIVDIIAKTPEDFIDSDESDDEDEIGIKMDSVGEQFPRHDVANTHYTTNTAKAQLPLLKIKIRGLRAGTSRQEDDIKPNNTQDESDDTQEQTHTNLIL